MVVLLTEMKMRKPAFFIFYERVALNGNTPKPQ
jgi:hypothetical protein